VGLPTKYKLTVENSPTDIIQGCIEKNTTSQELLYRNLYAEMIKVCLRYTNNLDDAASLYNEAMLKVFNKVQQYKFEGSFNGWVKRIVMNTCIDYCRKSTIYNKQIWVDEGKAENIAINPDAYSNIDTKEIMQLIMQLPKNTGIVFNMFVIDGYKHIEIAEALQISEGTSKWHLNEARRLLKTKLESLSNKKFYPNAS
jgi:RNA polymerase sigma-70 factor (ECF subfamily)